MTWSILNVDHSCAHTMVLLTSYSLNCNANEKTYILLCKKDNICILPLGKNMQISFTLTMQLFSPKKGFLWHDLYL